MTGCLPPLVAPGWGRRSRGSAPPENAPPTALKKARPCRAKAAAREERGQAQRSPEGGRREGDPPRGTRPGRASGAGRPTERRKGEERSPQRPKGGGQQGPRPEGPSRPGPQHGAQRGGGGRRRPRATGAARPRQAERKPRRQRRRGAASEAPRSEGGRGRNLAALARSDERGPHVPRIPFLSRAQAQPSTGQAGQDGGAAVGPGWRHERPRYRPAGTARYPNRAANRPAGTVRRPFHAEAGTVPTLAVPALPGPLPCHSPSPISAVVAPDTVSAR